MNKDAAAASAGDVGAASLADLAFHAAYDRVRSGKLSWARLIIACSVSRSGSCGLCAKCVSLAVKLWDIKVRDE